MSFQDIITKIKQLSPRQILFGVLCILLAVIMILTCVAVAKINTMFKTDTSTEPSESVEQTDPTQETEPTETAPLPTTDPDATIVTEPNHVHEWVLAESIKATCTNYGYNIYRCSCGKEEIPISEQVAPLGHNYGIGEVIAPTCTEGGCTRYTCSHCGDVREENATAALGHQYTLTHVDASCTENGYDLYTCTNPGCTENYTKNETPATGHRLVNWNLQADGSYVCTCTTCNSSVSSKDLTITTKQKSDGVVYDDNGTPYTLYRIYVGTESNKNLFLYEISDYRTNSNLTYQYDTSLGLIITYVDGNGQAVTEKLPILRDDSLIIPAASTPNTDNQSPNSP